MLLAVLNLVDTARWTFDDIIFILQPRKEAGQDSAAYCQSLQTARLVLALVLREVCPQILRKDVTDILSER